ncbi:hypothetical protein GLYMA_09G200100v4 [Glycine max]|uniref:Uncharacterized protein n=1 Tax=Glycine max TaxID=3847 RepID=K7LEY9_SOYBN|nr:hypothetical protein GLYMA_09G200100v4 [Glycine max]
MPPFLYLHYNIRLLYSSRFLLPSLQHGGPFLQPLLQHFAPSLYPYFATFIVPFFALPFLQHLAPSLTGCLHYSHLAVVLIAAAPLINQNHCQKIQEIIFH